MIQCPSCSEKIDGDEFGLVTCPQCGASMMVDFDGSVSEANGADSEPVSKVHNQDVEFLEPEDDNSPLDPEQAEVYGDQSEDEAVDQWSEGSQVYSIGENTGNYQLGNDVEPESESTLDHALEEDRFEVDQFSENESDDFVATPPPKKQMNEEFHDSVEHPYDGEYKSVNEMPEEVQQEASLSAIEEYGNSSHVNEGPLLYSVKISGIDSQEVREQIRQALSDRRLLFDVESMLRSVSDGELMLEEVSSLKTYVLINQLLGLPLKFEWGQQAHGNP